VPAYRSWRRLDPGAGAGVDARYHALPATTNAWIRLEGPERFVPAGTDIQAAIAAVRVERIFTSGTTGPPTPLLFSRSWWDASERASWLQHPVLAAVATGLHAEAVVASARCVGPGFAERALSAEERTLGRLLFVNEHADVAGWTEGTVRRMVRELEDHAPVVLEADPFYLAELCARAEALRLALPRPRVVVLTYALPSSTTSGPIDAAALAASLRGTYGARSQVRVEAVPALAPEPSGKYVASRSSVEVDRSAWFAPLPGDR
jgi:phenylacetate-coenzyme A ligase PaaK-like adenylate-forming protein